MVEITVGGGGELEGSEADIVERFIIDAVGLIGVLDELVDGEGGVVRLDDGVGDLGRRNDGEGVHHSVGVLFSDLGDEERSHAGAGSATEGVSQLESLEAIAGLGFLSGDVEHGIDELSSFCVVTFSPVVTGARLSKDEVVGSEDLAEGTRSDGIHRSWLEINKDCSGHVLAAGGFIVVDVDALELEIGVALVRSSWVDAMLVGDDFPELKITFEIKEDNWRLPWHRSGYRIDRLECGQSLAFFVLEWLWLW
jgi:hypothetical protein